MKNLRNYDPIWMGILTGLAALILWYFSSLAIDKSITPTTDKIWPFFSAGLGAFFGSYFAYLFRRHEEKQAKLNKRKSTLEACLFTLTRQYNAMFQMKRTYDEFPTDIDRAISMPAAKFPEYKDARIDFESLNFLTELKNVSHLLDLTIEQERFEQTILSINIRNDFHLEKLQPALEKHDMNGRELSFKEIESLLGPLIFHSAFNYANNSYELLCKNLDSNRESHQKTWEIAREIFPESEFLKPSPITPENASV
ncbi:MULTISPECIES: hypothetical protein [unclassified Pseudomonas]|uniref:hypothetical protein n=1 Tax=unclassified Pseudomonas TaxID=196821 RepID=UPI000C883145|nr:MULTISPECIES: hypothetical protein [unclassified Pseudomonas]PMX22448.1 hypothetical protein C1Y23_19670 [Pseudomonas sp. GW460-12]PMX34974.1 hypothetical protein C1Y24_11840 [Pseudomonas sp. MPR-R2A4]PMX41650.1 hypothetical protein C1Y26_09460 [Pseudomonas sp. MPR-R2A7]PMX54032.1 hypothetical protein C1Y17_10065 [Pseudomonas sp. MPR-R2A6]PMX91169.1 hypothetical protein C1Y21_12935 [Pseudomonas sp. MPR-R2A3]